MLSQNVIGTSFAFVNTGLTFLNNEFARGNCKLAEDGSKLPCPEAFGAMLGTASTVALVAILFAFTPPKFLRRIFTPLVTGSILLTIGLSLMGSGITNWSGGSGCQNGGLCPCVPLDPLGPRRADALASSPPPAGPTTRPWRLLGARLA